LPISVFFFPFDIIALIFIVGEHGTLTGLELSLLHMIDARSMTNMISKSPDKFSELKNHNYDFML